MKPSFEIYQKHIDNTWARKVGIEYLLVLHQKEALSHDLELIRQQVEICINTKLLLVLVKLYGREWKNEFIPVLEAEHNRDTQSIQPTHL